MGQAAAVQILKGVHNDHNTTAKPAKVKSSAKDKKGNGKAHPLERVLDLSDDTREVRLTDDVASKMLSKSLCRSANRSNRRAIPDARGGRVVCEVRDG
jgi:hypothetical protein